MIAYDNVRILDDGRIELLLPDGHGGGVGYTMDADDAARLSAELGSAAVTVRGKELSSSSCSMAFD